MTVEVRRNVSEQNVIIFQFELEFRPHENAIRTGGKGDKQSGKTWCLRLYNLFTILAI